MNTYESVQKWTVQTWNTGSSAWQAATSWPRGSVSQFSEKYVSTTQFTQLANGNLCAFTPETHENLQPITFTWQRRTTTSTFISNLVNYIDNKQGIKIFLHDSTNIQGYLISVEKIYDFSGSVQQYTILSEFQPFSIDGNSVTS